MANGTPTIEEERLIRLQHGRLMDKINAEAAIKGFAESVANKLNRMIAEGHDTTAFLIVMLLAIAKDGLLDIGLDFLGIGLIPIIGQVPGYFLSAVLFYIMHGKGMLRGKLFARVLIMFFADSLPIVEELPITVFAVLFAWRGLVKKAQKAEVDLVNLKNKTETELKELEREE